MGFSIAMLNSIRTEASQEYQNRIPVATQENISRIGQYFQTYSLLYNEYNEALWNKIGKTRIESKMYKNKLATFKKGEILSQQDVEEIFMEMIKAEGCYDATGPNPLGRRQGPNVQVAYHRQNREDYYAISIGDLDFLRVFQSEATLDVFISARLNMVFSSDQRDEFLAMKNVIATFPDKDGNPGKGYFEVEIDDTLEGEALAKHIVKRLRKMVLDVSEISKDYNPAGVETWSDPEELVLFVANDVLVEVDVELLSKAFHQSNTDLKVVPKIVPMKDFGSLAGTYMILAHKDWLEIWDTLSKMEPQRNAQGLFTNYFFHHHQILSASPFKTAIRFCKKVVED